MSDIQRDEWKDTIVINVAGGPCVGKTLLTAQLFVELKLAGYVCEYVPEYAKELVWQGDFDNLDNQYFVSKKQFQMVRNKIGKVDYVVTDGPGFQGIYYNRHNPTNNSDRKATEDMIIKAHNSFKTINILLIRGNHKYEKEGRQQTEEQAKEIDHEIRNIMNEMGINYRAMTCNPRDMSEILQYIETRTDQIQLYE